MELPRPGNRAGRPMVSLAEAGVAEAPSHSMACFIISWYG